MTVLANAPRVRAAADFTAVSVISFDLDDTLWDCAPAILRAEAVFYDWLTQVAPRVTASNDARSVAAFMRQFSEAHPELAGCVSSMRSAAIKVLLTNYHYDEGLADQGFDVFYRARSEVSLYPGVTELLSSLGKRYRLAAITNGNADLSIIGIDGYFDQIYAASIVLKAKPAAHMFESCCSHFGIAPENLLHVGDNPVSDIKGAIDAGAQSLWFNQHGLPWPEEHAAPHFEARSLSEVKSLLTSQ